MNPPPPNRSHAGRLRMHRLSLARTVARPGSFNLPGKPPPGETAIGHEGSLTGPPGRAQLAAVKRISPQQPRDLRRLGVQAIVLLQALVFAILPAVDAVLEAEAPSAVVHVEGEHREEDHSRHSHLLCQLARTVSPGFPPLIPIEPSVVFETRPDTPAANVWQRRPTPPGGSGPRAPPRA